MFSIRHRAMLVVSVLLVTAVLAPVGAMPNPPESSTADLLDWLAPTSDGRQPDLPALDPNVPSPADILGAPLGSRFHHHHQLLDYLEALAAASPRVEVVRYGETYEGRPLTLALISSPSNIARLGSIEADRAIVGDPTTHSADAVQSRLERSPSVVWLGYGVHGNESSSAEAALATAYVLAAGGDGIESQLEDVLVVLDPLMNPDGRERYVHGYRSRRGSLPNPDGQSSEHQEAWPGGRGNHYGIDLNRDWAWATQIETQQRLVAFRNWEPQVTVDLHEMSATSTYFFPPPAEPVHPRIDERARHWLEVFGRGNAQAFDGIGWTYYVADQFDLFYPGYGDSYPTLRGGIGMTYEVGGGGRAGATIDLADGRVRTLADRIARHLASSLATVATAATHSHELLEEFVARRRQSLETKATYYVWSATAPEANALATLLERHGIRVDEIETQITVEATAIDPRASDDSATLEAGDYLVSTAQPLGPLAAALIERQATIAPSFVHEQRQRVDDDRPAEFYDITAWSLPLAYGIPTWRTERALPIRARSDHTPIETDDSDPISGTATRSSALGYALPPSGLSGYALAFDLWSQGIRFRWATEALDLDGQTLPPGSLLIVAEDQAASRWSPLQTQIVRMAHESRVRLVPVTTSWTSAGVDLGSSRLPAAAPPRIGLLRGDGLSPTSFGALWHLLDRDLRAPHSVLSVDRVGHLSLASYDTLILPDGWDFSALDDSTIEALERWLQSGGQLIAIEGAARWVEGSGLLGDGGSEPHGDPELPAGPDGEDGNEPPEASLLIPGALVAAEVERHPMTRNGTAQPFWLFYGKVQVSKTDHEDRTLVRAADDSNLVGFAWPEGRRHLPGTPLLSYQTLGSGRVVLFHQDPAFRLFTRGTLNFLLDWVLFGHAAS